MNMLLRLFCTAAFVASLSLSCLLRGAVATGAAAPDFTLQDLDGASHKLSEYKGKIVVLEWNNPECPFVQKNYERSGNLPNLQKKAKAAGVVWLVINSGAPGKEGGDYSNAALKQYLLKNHAEPNAYLTDHEGNVGHAFGAKTTPHLFVIATDGTVAYQGAIDSIRSTDPKDLSRATNYVEAALDALKAGKPVQKATTEPYGCSVKY